jgi:hypothetical protein
LLDHYPLYLAEEATTEIVYIFDSEVHGEYYISFRPAKHRFTDKCEICHVIYELNFTPLTPKDRSKGVDLRIHPTILKAIEIFVSDFNCPVLYVCDTEDSRHRCRSRLFARWFGLVDQKIYRHKSVEFQEFDLNLILSIVGFAADPHFDLYFDELYSYKD